MGKMNQGGGKGTFSPLGGGYYHLLPCQRQVCNSLSNLCSGFGINVVLKVEILFQSPVDKFSEKDLKLHKSMVA